MKIVLTALQDKAGLTEVQHLICKKAQRVESSPQCSVMLSDTARCFERGGWIHGTWASLIRPLLKEAQAQFLLPPLEDNFNSTPSDTWDSKNTLPPEHVLHPGADVENRHSLPGWSYISNLNWKTWNHGKLGLTGQTWNTFCFQHILSAVFCSFCLSWDL